MDRNVQIRHDLLDWFAEHGRRFMWRQSAPPFVVLIAEVLLKKTTASVVERFIPEFLTRYSDPYSIAESTKEELQGILAPIGLSAQRADQLMNLAVALIRDHNGKIPHEMAQLLDLPGIGPYSASAVRCYAFGKVEAPVDTNIARILVRFHGITPSRYEARRSPEIWQLASELVGKDAKKVREVNWALLDLGAKVCTSRQPKCGGCPLASGCHFVDAS